MEAVVFMSTRIRSLVHWRRRAGLPRFGGEAAQGVVEFAIIASLLMLLFLGTMDFGRFMYYDTAIRSAARVGAEAATNQCPNQTMCGTFSAMALNDGIFQSTECEASNDARISLKPQISCSNCVSTYTGCTNGDPCTSGCSTSWCEQDMCIQRHETNCNSDIKSVSSSVPGQCITVTVGYNFQPISPLMNTFFPTQQCWSGDTTTHTLCATSKGRVY